ncbi:protein kinase [Kitasatospora sp. Ki12]
MELVVQISLIVLVLAVTVSVRSARRRAKRRRHPEQEHAGLLAAPRHAPGVGPPPVFGAAPPAHRPVQSASPAPPALGSLGRFRLTARLGQGGMGTVYLGLTPGGRPVAVKVINPELAVDPGFRRRFAREVEAARTVGGFHTAPVVDADPHGDPPWLATEYIPGPSLQEVLQRHGAVPVRTLHALAAGIAEALAEIHGSGVIHRDLKPSNVIVSGTGPRLIDFGIAQLADGTQLTSTGFVIGTPGFVAPEQLSGAPVTSAVDLYAFGMVLCHAAGAAPFPQGTSLESALGMLPTQLAGIIARCLDHDPGRRPTASDVLRQLSGVQAPVDDWLPPPVRTMVDGHHLPGA